MLKSELEVGKTYTHRTGASYRSSELVTLESLEPQKARNARTWAKPSANLVLVSYASRYQGEETTARKTVLIKNLYPEQEYHEEKAHARLLAEARKVREQQGNELDVLLYNRGQEIAELLGVERRKLQKGAINTITITHTYTLDQIKELLGEKVS
jgi:superfamily I DNA and/or RNA helicase